MARFTAWSSGKAVWGALLLSGMATMATATTVVVDGPGDGDGLNGDEFDTITLALAALLPNAGDGVADVVEIVIATHDEPAGFTVNHFNGGVSDNITIRSNVPGTQRHLRITPSGIGIAAVPPGPPCASVVALRTGQTVTFEDLIFTPGTGAGGQVDARAMQVYNELVGTNNATLTVNRCHFTALRPTGHPNAGQPIINPLAHAASDNTNAARIADLRAFSGGGANNVVELRNPLAGAPSAGATVTYNFNCTVFTHNLQTSATSAARGGGIALSRLAQLNLNINPGCIFSFNGGSGLRTVGTLAATANVNIDGTPAQPVIFYKNGWMEEATVGGVAPNQTVTNVARGEGALVAGGVLTVDNAHFVGNFSHGLSRQGTVASANGVTITNSIFAENQSNLIDGANFYNTLNVANLNLENNGVSTLTNCTIHDARASFDNDRALRWTGAAGSTLNMTNCVISGHGDLVQLGGAAASTANETNCTFAVDGVSNNSPNGLEEVAATFAVNNGYGAGVAPTVIGRQLADPEYFETNYDPIYTGVCQNIVGLGSYLAVANVDLTTLAPPHTGANPSVAFAAAAPGDYVWDGGGGADNSFTNPLNWNPDRAAAHRLDRFRWGAGVWFVVRIPNLWVRLWRVENGGRVVWVKRGEDRWRDDNHAHVWIREALEIEPGCEGELRGEGNIDMRLRTGATGAIRGRFTINGRTNNARHRLSAADAGAITVFNGASIAVAPGGNGCEGGFYSTVANYGYRSAIGSIVYQSGAFHFQGGTASGTRFGFPGTAPHGYAVPDSTVVFQPGSTCQVLDGSPDMAGRTYGNFTWAGSQNANVVAGSGTCTVADDFSVIPSGIGPQGQLFQNQDIGYSILGNFLILDNSGGMSDNGAISPGNNISVAGDVTIDNAALFNPSTDPDRVYVLNGAGTQDVDVNGESVRNVTVSGTGPIIIRSGARVENNANNGTAIIETQIADLTLGSTAVYTTSGGWFQPDVIRDLPAGTGSYLFQVGTSDPQPVTISYPADGPDNPVVLQVESVDGDHPSVTNPPAALNRYWSITPTGTFGNNEATVTVEYDDPADIVGVGNEGDLKVGANPGGGPGPWTTYPTTNNTAGNTAGTTFQIQSFFDVFTDLSLFESPVLAVDLASFSAAQTGSTVTVSWSTVAELDNAGFVVHRANADGSKGEKLSGLIPAEGSATAGASYSFVDDAPIAAGETSRSYLLVDIDLAGAETTHGPATATITTGSPSSVGNWTMY